MARNSGLVINETLKLILDELAELNHNMGLLVEKVSVADGKKEIKKSLAKPKSK